MNSTFQIKKKALLHVIFFLLPFQIFSQNIDEIYKVIDGVYGKDTRLYSGQKNVIERRCDFGNPYLFTNGAVEGSVCLNGMVYNNLMLNYNIYDGKVMLEFTNTFGATGQILFLNKEVDWFKIDDCFFAKSGNEGIENKFVEIIGTREDIHFLFLYTKTYGFINNNSVTGFGYSKTLTKKYLVIDQRPIFFKGKNDFIKVLPENLKDAAKKFIKSQPVPFREFKKAIFIDLCNYLNTL